MFSQTDHSKIMPYHVKRLFYPFVPYLILFIGFIYLKTAGKSIFLIYSFDLKYALNTSSDPTFLLLAWRPASKQSFFYFLLTIEKLSDKIQNNFIHQTVEAEITAMMPLQRACAGESQVRVRWETSCQMDRWGCSQKFRYFTEAQYSATWRHTSVAGDMLVSC